MPKSSSSNSGKFKPAAGLIPTLQERSKKRRETQKRLSGLQDPPSIQRRRNDLLPDLHVEYLSIDQLKPAKRRVRKLDEVQSARLDRSIADFGICLPILVDRDGRIVHFHGVWEAAKRAGLPRVPTIEVSHLSPEKQRALAIALNRLGETGRWDERALAVELEELIDLEEDILVTGFDMVEVDALLLDDGDSKPASEALPKLPVTSISQPGDLWSLGDHLLLQGDALDPASYRQLFSDDRLARAVLTDEPYNVKVVGHITSKKHHEEFAFASGELTNDEFAAFNRTWLGNATPFLMDGGLLATFIDWRGIETVLAAGRGLGLSLLNLVVWQKTNGGQGSFWRSQHELLPIFKNGTASHVNNVQLGRFGRWRSNVWVYPGGSSLASEARACSDDHPTVKPRAMLEDALLDVTNRGEIVLDPFLGSGSTLMAAETTGRICRAIEIDGRYCDVAIERWQVLAGAPAILATKRETFAQVARQRTEAVSLQEDSDGQKAEK